MMEQNLSAFVMKRRNWYATLLFLALLWTGAHWWGGVFGTANVPIHGIYVGDEQAPIYAALHMLKENSLLGMRDERVLYYGPIFALFAVPAVIADLGYRFLTEGTASAIAYKTAILYDWGSTLLFGRIVTVLVCLAGLAVAYHLFLHPTINPSRSRWLALFGASMIAVNFYYFENSHFFRHWTFVLIAFLLQALIALYLWEARGRVRWHWWVHGACTLFIFGVSYVGILFEIAFLPLAYLLWKQGDRMVRMRMVWYAGSMLLGAVLIVLWHPYAFLRYVAFFGFGPMVDMVGSVIVETENPLAGGKTSFLYYGRLIVENHVSLVLAGLVLAYMLVKSRITDVAHVVWLLLAAGLVNYLFFGLTEHHEGRYVLPTVVFFVVAVTAAYIRYLHLPGKRVAWIWGLGLLFAWYAVFHVVHDVRWMYLRSLGPAEQAMVEEALRLQTANEDVRPILLLDTGLVGHVHTKEAYDRFAKATGKGEYNVFKELQQTDPPHGTVTLNAHYATLEAFLLEPNIADQYAHVLWYRYTQWVPDNDPFVEMNESLLRLWYDPKKLEPWYIRLK